MINRYRKQILAGFLALCFLSQGISVLATEESEATVSETKPAEEENQESESAEEEVQEPKPSEEEVQEPESSEEEVQEPESSEEEVQETESSEEEVQEPESSENSVQEPEEKESEPVDSLPERSLSQVEQEMDSALNITSGSRKLRRFLSGSAKKTADGEPGVSITKNAKWIDIERGIAQIDLTETDTPGYTNQGVDYVIILDRTRTMSLNDLNFQGGESDHVGTSNSPCLNRDHYYEYDGKKLDLYDYTNGLIRGTDTVVTLPEDAELYNCHKNAAGETIPVRYDSGCQDRLSLAKQTICGLIDKIAANSPKGEGEVSNRVSYWSFAGTYWPEQEGELDTDPEKGIYNYIALTDDFAAVKNKVNETMTYAGTYYQDSMKRAYEQLSSRTGLRKDAPSKVIFISDGKCSDDHDEVTYWNNMLREIPGCTVYTLAVGMPVASEGAIFLKNLSSNRNSTTFAAFTTNLNTSNPAFADTLSAIEEAAVKTTAGEKVMTDRIETKYWDFERVLSADGSASCKDGVLTWNIPEEEGKTWKCSIRVRLKDSFRFLVSDTTYPTNADTEKEKGCRIDYEILGGAKNGQKRTIETETPNLLYGAIEIEGVKHWTIEDSQAEQVRLKLSRHLDGKSDIASSTLGEAELTKKEKWRYTFSSRMEDGEKLPLVLYNNEGGRYIYDLSEDVSFYQLTEKKESKDGEKIRQEFFNEPYKIMLRMMKKDAQSKEGVAGATFGVYAFSRAKNDYVPYTGDGKRAEGGKQLMLADDPEETGYYITPEWLYYTPDNEGRFRVIEEQAPSGYVGDYKDFDSKEKNIYDVQITADNTGTTVFETSDGDYLCVENKRVMGCVRIYKRDGDSLLGAPQGTATLFYQDESRNARYGIFRTDDTLVKDGRIGADGTLAFENLELGSYYVRELDTPPEGYLLDDTTYPVNLLWEGEDKQEVKVQLEVSEPVKKQRQKIYKVGGDGETAEPSWVKDAGFMVFSYRDLGFSDREYTDEEVMEMLKEKYRNPKTLTYEAMGELPGVLFYENGEARRLEEFSGSDGILETPALPYGDYVLAETSVPKGKRSVEPVILHIREDENDKEKEGDGGGTKRNAIVLYDRDVQARVRIVKSDSREEMPVCSGEAAYVIRDVEGAWKEWYFKKASVLEKARYMLLGDGLVLEYDASAGTWRGTRENPYRTEKGMFEGKKALTILTENELPQGMYELEEVEAPEGYVLSGHEGVIARSDQSTVKNGTFYETEENGHWQDAAKSRTRFIVDGETADYDAQSHCWWINVIQENDPVIGKLSILAQADRLIVSSDKTSESRYERVPQKGAEFALYAKEDVVAGTGTVLYPKGTLVRTFVTDGKGQAWSGDSDNADGTPAGLPLGTYELVQTKAGEGFELDEKSGKSKEVVLSWKDSLTPVVYRDESFLLTLVQTNENPEASSGGINETTAYKSNGNPKTGDAARPEALILLGLCSLGVIVRRRRKQ